MFTNIDQYGGNFKDVLERDFRTSNNVIIASGYTSTDLIKNFEPDFLRIASHGGTSRLLLGMAFYEGLNQKKLDTVNDLNTKLKEFSPNCGIYVAYGRRFHGKIYKFSSDSSINIYVGSSNFSASGTKGNIECTIPVLDTNQKSVVSDFLSDLYSETYSVPIDQAEITVPGKKKVVLGKVERLWNSLQKYDSSGVNVDSLPKFIFPLNRIAEKEKSNLNVYFGRGRWSRSTGKIMPRPWYEIELIASNDLNSEPHYPKGDFLAFTDDGLIIPMRTQGDYYKNIRSRNSLQIFGIWLKGKLEQSGALRKYQPVTNDVLQEFGCTELVFSKFEEGRYYMHFKSS